MSAAQTASFSTAINSIPLRFRPTSYITAEFPVLVGGATVSQWGSVLINNQFSFLRTPNGQTSWGASSGVAGIGSGSNFVTSWAIN